MMKIIIAFIILLSTIVGAQAATIYASSCSSSDVQNAINSANRGDIVVVSGSCTWTSYISISKAITLSGDATITSNRSSTAYKLVYIEADNPDSDVGYTYRITGLTWNLNSKSGWLDVENDTVTSGVVPTAINLRVDHNTVTGAIRDSTSTRVIDVNGVVWGVFDNNSISGQIYIEIDGLNSGGNPGKDNWNGQTWNLGSGDALYFEDNTFDYYESVYEPTHQIFTSSGGGRYVARYNTIDVGTHYGDWKQVFDIHGNENGVRGSFGAELYGNKILQASNQTLNLVQYMGGTGTNFYNWVSVGGSGIGTQEMKERVIDNLPLSSTPDPDAYPTTTNYTCPSGSLYLYPSTSSCSSNGQPQHVWNQYNWNNRYGTATGTLISAVYNSNKYYPNYTWAAYVGGTLLEGTHFWDDTSVSCGSDIPSGSCTAGQAKWVTNQSCSDLTNFTGASHSSNITGTLYRCNPTNVWSAYYTPYTYPHPLRGESDTTDPVISLPCAGISSCTYPIVELPCTDESEPYTMDVIIGAVTNENATVKYDSQSGTDYGSGVWDGTMSGGGGTTHTATLTGLACGSSYTRYLKAKDTAGNITDNDTVLTFTIASKSGVIPTVTDLSGSEQGYNPRGQLLKVQTSVPSTCRYTTVSAGTPWEYRTQFGTTGDTVFHATQLQQEPSSTVNYYVLCRDTQQNESANKTVPITVQAGLGISSSGGGLQINLEQQGDLLIDF